MRRKTPVAMEPRACLAEYDAARDALTLHSATQMPGIVRDALAMALDHPGRPHSRDRAGCRRRIWRQGVAFPGGDVRLRAARKLGRPVKWTSDRLEDLTATSQAFDEIVDAELALDRRPHRRLARRRHRQYRRLFDLSVDRRARAGAGGELPARPLSFRNIIAAVSVACPPRSRRPALIAASAGPPRPSPWNAWWTWRRAKLASTPQKCAGATSSMTTSFPIGSHQASSGINPPFSSACSAACDAAEYEGARAKQKRGPRAGRWVGIGIASYAELTGIGSRISVAPGMPINTGTETAIIRIDSTGAITASFGVASHGQGLETTLAQVVAEHLGARFEDIQVVHGDSAAVAGGTGTYASRSMVLAGGAATLARKPCARRYSTPHLTCSKPRRGSEVGTARCQSPAPIGR